MAWISLFLGLGAIVPKIHTYNTLISLMSIGKKIKKLQEKMAKEPTKASLRVVGKITGRRSFRRWYGIAKQVTRIATTRPDMTHRINYES